MDKQEYSEFWLANNADSYNNRHKSWHRERIDAVLESIPKGSKCLDVACGNGEITGLLKEKRNCTIKGYEIGDKAIEFARKRHPSIEFIRGDALNLPFSENEFEWVHAGEIIEHLDNPEQLIQGLARLCSKGTVITTPDRVVEDPQHISVFTKESLKKLCLKHFKGVTIKNPKRTLVAVCEHKEVNSKRVLFVTPVSFRKLSGATIQLSNQLKAIVKAGYEVDCLHYSNTHYHRPIIEGVNFKGGFTPQNIRNEVAHAWKKGYDWCICRSPELIMDISHSVPKDKLIGYVYGDHFGHSQVITACNKCTKVVIQGDKRYIDKRIQSEIQPIDICTDVLKKKFTIGHIQASGMVQYHDLETVVKAVEIVREKHDVNLLNIGDTDIERDWLIRLGKMPHNFMPFLMSNIDVFVSLFIPGKYSANLMSTKGLETISLGTPIITDPSYGYVQMLGEDYKLFATTPEEIAEKIVYLIDNPQKKLDISKELLKRVDKFSIDAISKQWNKLLKEEK